VTGLLAHWTPSSRPASHTKQAPLIDFTSPVPHLHALPCCTLLYAELAITSLPPKDDVS
jgi:hypothetical protein